jgi:hypothetical protein
MRNLAILLTATALTTLSACSGGDTQSASGTAVSSGTTGGTATATDPYAEFVNPTAPRTYQGIGGTLVMDYNTDDRTVTNGASPFPGDDSQQGYAFGGYSSTVRSSKISLSYDPRDAIFTLVVKDVNNNNTDTRFQDPASRTDFAGARTPQWGVDDLSGYGGIGKNANYAYLQAGDGDPRSLYLASGSGFVIYGDNNTPPRPGNIANAATYQATNLFFERPGTNGTRYVSLAGFIRNAFSWQPQTLSTGKTIGQTIWHLERGAFAYGLQTDQNAVPKTGNGTYAGTMLATMVFNPTLDAGAASYPNYFQWISGTSSTTVNFATGAVGLQLDGIVGRPIYDYQTSPQQSTIALGTTFTATGTATIDLVRAGGFTGQFQSARFGATTNSYSPIVNIAGSTIDGAFFGPAAEEVGGGFRIVGGNPDQRIDIVGAFKGKKP